MTPHDKAFVMLRSSGSPVALSTGVPLFTRKMRVPGCEVHTRTYSEGGFNHPIWMPGLGPDVTGWSSSQYRPPGHPFTQENLDKIDRGAPIDFSQLSTPEVFFTRDKEGEFVLMDAWTRKMVQVSPLGADFKAAFWGGIVEAFKIVRENQWKFVTPPSPETWMPPGGVDPLFKGEVWLCLHPAPFHKGEPVVWTFDGARAVLFDVDPEPGSPEANHIAEEQLYGLEPYEV